MSLRCQLSSEDLDALVSITFDEDLTNLIKEYDKAASSPSSLKIRAFLSPPKPPRKSISSPLPPPIPNSSTSSSKSLLSSSVPLRLRLTIPPAPPQGFWRQQPTFASARSHRRSLRFKDPWRRSSLTMLTMLMENLATSTSSTTGITSNSTKSDGPKFNKSKPKKKKKKHERM